MRCINIGSLEPTERTWFEVVEVTGSKIKMKIDTGVETNSIPMRTWGKIPDKANFIDNGVILKSFRGAHVEHAGMANVRIGMGQTHTKAEILLHQRRLFQYSDLKHVW